MSIARFLAAGVMLACAMASQPAAAAGKNQTAAPDDNASIEQGHKIVSQHCARCHAIGRTGASPLAQAVPFRDFAKRWPLHDLEEALAEGIMTGHPDMPAFAFEPDQIAAIIDYIASLSAPQK